MPEEKVEPVRLRAGRITLEDGAYLAGPNLYRERVPVEQTTIDLASPLNPLNETDQRAVYIALSKAVDAHCASLDAELGPFGYEDPYWRTTHGGWKVHVVIYGMRDRVDFMDVDTLRVPFAEITLPLPRDANNYSDAVRAYAKTRAFESDRTLAVAPLRTEQKGDAFQVTLGIGPVSPPDQ